MTFLRKRRIGYLMKRLEKRRPIILLIVFIIVLILWYIDYSTSPFVTPSFVLLKEEDDEFLDEVYELPENDYNKLINISFEFSMINLVCKKSFPIFLLVLVPSAPKNFHLRKFIRDTWGKQEKNIKVVFMLGSVKSVKIQKALEEENMMNGDLVQGSFLDVYSNITYKHIMAFKYFLYFCPQAKYILKADDDGFVNMQALKNLIHYYLSPHGVRKGIFCLSKEGHQVVRSRRYRWRVSVDEYPAEFFPSYCLGFFVLYSPDVVLALYKEAQQQSHFMWLDDVFVSGVLRQKLNLTITQLGRLYLNRRRKYILLNYPFLYYLIDKPFVFTQHNLKIEEKWKVQEFVLAYPPPKYIYYV